MSESLEVALDPDKVTRIKRCSQDDPTLLLRETIQQGWPDHILMYVSAFVHTMGFETSCSEHTTVFKGSRVIFHVLCERR